ncbi:MAG: glycosyltransferase family 2 protein, partial [Rikenellaceae bacterium]
MKSLHIITPVKDSIDSTLESARAIMSSELSAPFTYTIYNDFSTPENTKRLEEAAIEFGFELVNLSDITDHPSPNYLLV